MALDKANELLAMHPDLDSGNNHNAARMVSGEVDRDHKLEEKWQIKPGTRFTSAFTK